MNRCQSTNDVYPTAFRVALYESTFGLLNKLKRLITAFDDKAVSFNDVLKMGRTQLQDAVPMTLGREFHAFAVTLREEIKILPVVRNCCWRSTSVPRPLVPALRILHQIILLWPSVIWLENWVQLHSSRRLNRSHIRLWRLFDAAWCL